MKKNWDLSPLFKSENDPQIEITKAKAEEETEKFVKKWKKNNQYLNDPDTLKKALDEYEKYLRFFGAAYNVRYFFHLLTSLDQNNTSLKAKENKIIEFSKNLENKIQFFEINLSKIDTKKQKIFLNNKSLKPYKHFLEKLFIRGKHTLSEAEEKIINLKSIPAHNNWVRMVSGFLAKEEAKVKDEDKKIKTKTLPDLLGLMNSKDKKVRDIAAKAFNFIQKKYADIAEHEINSIVLDKKIDDDLRGFNRPDKSRHINDDIETEIVDVLIKTVSSHFEIAKKYYKLKAKILGVKKLKYHERNVEIGNINKKIDYEKAVFILEKAFQKLDPEFLQIFKDFILKGRVDVYPKKGKYSGAFCDYGLISQPSYSLLNWTNKLNDVLTFAHEIGHGINFELVRKAQNALNFGVTVTTAEVASTFMEDFVLEELKKNTDDKTKLALSMMKLNEDISTIFRQTALYNFELELHDLVRKKGYLDKSEIGELFQKHMKSYMGPCVEQSEGSENWWVYWSHIRYFFYTYSYAMGLLISKYLQAKVKENPKFILKVKQFLSVGLSESPKETFLKLGIDIRKKDFWQKGISEVENLLSETEKLTDKLKNRLFAL